MFELYGCKCGRTQHGGEEYGVLLATFSTEKRALAYVKKSRLKYAPGPYAKNFRSKSLLGDYWSAFVREREEPLEVPHDPEL